MTKEFNITGLCNPQIHYMADISDKVDQIYEIVEKGKYFTINKPHQYGKTTIQTFLANRINQNEDSIALDISFEEIDYEIYQSKTKFINAFLKRLAEGFKIYGFQELSEYINKEIHQIETFDLLSSYIGNIIQRANKKITLLIDEVDRSSNNQLFLDFLAILRGRYLKRNKSLSFSTFHSVILSGVYDVKKIKFKIDPQSTLKYNSPWNIAIDFDVDLSLNTTEIQSMLNGYAQETGIKMDSLAIAQQLYYYTSGHPFLASYLCKIVDEKIMKNREDKTWQIEDVDEAFKQILTRTNTNFESLIKNLENNQELYDFVYSICVTGKEINFNNDDPVIDFGKTVGILMDSDNRVKIHNKVYEQRIYNYMVSKISRMDDIPSYRGKYVKNNVLDAKSMLLGFQSFMKENHNKKDKAFLEKHGTLLFLAFVKPIINGKGFDFKEVQISEERRLDVVITYLNQKYIIELKIWRGKEAHNEGLNQLSDYLDRQNLKTGYLLIYDFRIQEKEYKQQNIKHQNKDIFAVWV